MWRPPDIVSIGKALLGWSLTVAETLAAELWVGFAAYRHSTIRESLTLVFLVLLLLLLRHNRSAVSRVHVACLLRLVLLGLGRLALRAWLAWAWGLGCFWCWLCHVAS
jgi:hypothetical protein